MATIGHIMSQIMRGKVKTSDPVELVTYKQFCRVSLDTPLRQVSKMLDVDHFVLVVHNQRMGKRTASICHFALWTRTRVPIDIYPMLVLYLRR